MQKTYTKLLEKMAKGKYGRNSVVFSILKRSGEQLDVGGLSATENESLFVRELEGTAVEFALALVELVVDMIKAVSTLVWATAACHEATHWKSAQTGLAIEEVAV